MNKGIKENCFFITKDFKNCKALEGLYFKGISCVGCPFYRTEEEFEAGLKKCKKN